VRTDTLVGSQTVDAFSDDAERRIWAETPELANITHSFSGNERNRLFLNQKGRQFLDVSGVSGIDSPSDGRAFVLWDYDRDGLVDVAVVNSNPPLLNLHHNQIVTPAAARVIALRFVGGNQTDLPSQQYSARDGYGTKVRMTAGALELWREHHCGEGLAAQNSATMLIGLDQRSQADLIEITWPSGLKHSIRDVSADTLLTIFENPDDAPDGSDGVERESYRIGTSAPLTPAVAVAERPVLRFVPSGEMIATADPLEQDEPTRLTVYILMATWCVACRQHQPEINALVDASNADFVRIVGLAIDEEDSLEKLTAYAKQYKLDYPLMTKMTSADRDLARRIVSAALDTDAMPASIVCDASGRVLLTLAGVPTVSQLRKLQVKKN
jgi:thiol-disulfide isomerase/thioredoxin